MLVRNCNLLSALSWLLLTFLAVPTLAKEKQLNLLLAGNMPDISIDTYGTYSGLANTLEKIRSDADPTVFIFAGGSLGPSPLSSLDRGSHIIDILNTLEPDLMTLAKREFSYFEDELTLRSYEAAFPIITSNIYDPVTGGNLEGIVTSLIVEKSDSKIGFISILDEEVVEEYLLQRIRVLEPKSIIEHLIGELRQKGADFVVLVYSKERDYYQDLIANQQIDFALSALPIVENSAIISQPEGVYSIANREPVALLKLIWQSDSPQTSLRIERQDIDSDSIATDLTTAEVVKDYRQRLNRLLDQKIGQFGTGIQTARNLVRTREMPFGNFIADALKDYAKTDIGLINGGVIRGDKTYNADAVITRRDIATELPFRAHINVLQLTGAQLKQALEHSVSQVELAKGRFLQVSGLAFSYSLTLPAGKRVQTILVKGQAIDLERQYTVATSDYLANGGDGYSVFADLTQKSYNMQSPPLLSDIVIRAIQQQQIIVPELELRIKQIVK